MEPPEALGWYGRWLTYQWRRLDRAEVRTHTKLMRRYPLTAKSVEWCLGFIYDIIISPAFAIILALLLVGLVASEIVTIIVSLSIISAWLIFVITVARYVKSLPILRRFIVVALFACVAASLSQLYVRWILDSYARRHQVEPIAHVLAPAPSSIVSVDAAALAQLKDLFQQELQKVEKTNKHGVAVPERTETTCHLEYNKLLDCTNAQVLDWGKPLLSRLDDGIKRCIRQTTERIQEGHNDQNSKILESAFLNRALETDYNNFVTYRGAVVRTLKGGDPHPADPLIFLTSNNDIWRGKLVLRDMQSNLGMAMSIQTDLQDLSSRLARQVAQEVK
jgi:hypothetical protein